MSTRGLPSWFRQPLPSRETIERMERLRAQGVDTVCREARCPNSGACLSAGRITFLILGRVCTRRCAFCSVDKSGAVKPPDRAEPARIVSALKETGASYCVVTSVCRDDLPDGGAGQFAAVIRLVRQQLPRLGIEVLLPDFQGDRECLCMIALARPDVAGHNLETVRRLYPALRPQAKYRRSLEVLARLKSTGAAALVKSGLMLGLGETPDETLAAMRDIRETGCDVLVLGQYLAPSVRHAPVRKFITPESFDQFRRAGLEMGFREVLAGPLVRSSYRAEEVFNSVIARPQAEATSIAIEIASLPAVARNDSSLRRPPCTT